MHLRRLVRSHHRRHRYDGQQPFGSSWRRRRRGRVTVLALLAAFAAPAGTLAHQPLGGAGVAVLLLVVLVVVSRRRIASSGPWWPPGGPGGSAGVREPRHPHPSPPAGALALPVPHVPDDEVAALA